MIYVIFSIGQFVNSNLDSLKEGFSSWFKENSNPNTGESVWEWMRTSGQLKSLRLGQITTSDLHNAFNSEFDVNMDFKKFSTIFNSMCLVNQEMLDRIKNYKEYLDKTDGVQFILVSHTNYSHLNFILSQISPILQNTITVMSKEKPWDIDAKFVLVPSMVSQCEEHKDTLAFAMKELVITENDPIISFLNSIKGLDHEKFQYTDPGQDHEQVTEAIDKAHSLHLSIRY